jgi:hypothetical protein
VRRIAKSTQRHRALGSEGRATIRLLTVTAVGGYRARLEPLTLITSRANSTKVLRFRTCGRLYLYDTIL